MPDILALIPARAGSKGLPGKNIRPLCGKPLVAWSIEAARGCKYVTRTVVSSDSDEILKVASVYGADVIKRPYLLALDDSSSESVVMHALDLPGFGQYSHILLLQPTSALRTAEDLDRAVETLLAEDAQALISVQETDNKILKAFVEHENGTLQGICNNHYPFMPRQKLPATYMSNGAIYLIETEIFKQSQSFLAPRTVKFLMSAEKSLDIDTLEDFMAAEAALKAQLQQA